MNKSQEKRQSTVPSARGFKMVPRVKVVEWGGRKGKMAVRDGNLNLEWIEVRGEKCPARLRVPMIKDTLELPRPSTQFFRA